MNEKKEMAGFLLKVLVLSAGLSILIKVAGPSLVGQGWAQKLQGRSLNYVAIALVTLPSLVVGTFLFFKSRQSPFS
ncbi:MAG: hypothetical protein WA783_00935 [Phormidesmis sp.]